MSKAWCFGDNINTDNIIPGRRNITTDIQVLARYAFEHVKPNFSEKVQPGDIIIAGQNFGCGSSREHAVLAIKGSGIKHIVAKSYASIFFRNCINNGVLPLKIIDIVPMEDGESVKIDLETFNLIDKNGTSYSLQQLPPFLIDIVGEGGLVPYLNKYENYFVKDREN